MPDVFVIIGERNSRKSSTTRALTGAYWGTGTRGQVYQIETICGDVLPFYVQISSLQESKSSPQDFIDEINGRGSSNVLVTLWIPKGNNQPTGFVYIEAFLNAGWNIREIVVLGTDRLPYTLPENTPPLRFIQNSDNLPNNNIASQIRNWWQWL